MEIKHGRSAMLGFIHVLLIHAGVRFPGYLSPSNELKFADMPVGCFSSLEATPTAGWLAIMLVTCMTETGASALTARFRGCAVPARGPERAQQPPAHPDGRRAPSALPSCARHLHEPFRPL